MKTENENCKWYTIKGFTDSYYFLSSYYTKEIVEQAGLKLDLGFKPKRCKAVYFEKGGNS